MPLYRRKPRRATRRRRFPLSKPQVRAVKKISLGTLETKTQNQDISTTVHSTSGYNGDFCNISSGDGQGNRDGNQVKLTSVSGTLTFIKEQNVAAQQTDTIRVIMYIPKDSDEYIDATVATNYYAGFDLDSYTILSDRTVNLSKTAGARTISFFRRLRSRVIWKSGTGNDWAKNAVKFAVFNNAGASYPMYVQGRVRTKYKDI